MKILSKFKDYYDGCVVYFGRDETRIYDRRIQDSLIPEKLRGGKPILFDSEYYDSLVFHICGELKIVLHNKGIFYFSHEEIPLHHRNTRFISSRYFGSDGNKTDLNQKYRQPVLLTCSYGGQISIPILADLQRTAACAVGSLQYQTAKIAERIQNKASERARGKTDYVSIKLEAESLKSVADSLIIAARVFDAVYAAEDRESIIVAKG